MKFESIHGIAAFVLVIAGVNAPLAWTFLPLPKGEGRGEGEGSMANPNIESSMRLHEHILMNNLKIVTLAPPRL